jgi:hypothetical protein
VGGSVVIAESADDYSGFAASGALRIGRDSARSSGVWAAERAAAQTTSLPKLNSVAGKPGASVLDQPGERLAESLDGIADLLGIDIGRGMLQSTLEHVEPVQQHRLIFGQPAVGGDLLEDLLGVWPAVRKQTD